MKTLRPYQQDALTAVIQAYENKKGQALVVMATGLGKMVLAARLSRWWMQKARPGSRISFLMHMTDPLFQAKDQEFGDAVEDLQTKMGVLSGIEKTHTDAQIVFSTFQSMDAARDTFLKDAFDLVFVDEAHHAQAESYRDVIEYFTPELRVGLTATPDRRDGLDIQELFGEPVYSYSLEEALADGQWLARVDYRLMIDSVSKVSLQELLRRVECHEDRDITVTDIDRTVFLPERTERILEEIRLVQGATKQTVVFCQSVIHLEHLNESMPDARSYHSDLSPVLLRERLADFRAGGFQTILVVDKFNEAIDIPDAEVLVFLRPTDSETIWRQQIGRGVRKTETKDSVIILDFIGNCARIYQITKLRDAIQKFAKEKEKVSPPVIPEIGIQFNFSAETLDVLSILNRVPTNLYETVEEAMEAVQKLTPIPTTGETYSYFRFQDPRLPPLPYYTYQTSWDRIGKWKGFLKTAVYPTVEEAMCAVKKLIPVPKTVDAYQRIYTQDPRLVMNPIKYYKKDWKRIRGWKGFLDVAFYETIEKAIAAVQKLKPVPTCKDEYRRVCEQDPKLPKSPNQYYRWNWETFRWPGFLGITSYASIEKAMEAVQKLIPLPKNRAQYREVTDQDLCLPYSPDVYFKSDWERIGQWPGFLGNAPKHTKYATIKEAMAAIHLLPQIPSGPEEYWKLYKADPRLPSNPYNHYKTDWERVGKWPGFLGRLNKTHNSQPTS